MGWIGEDKRQSRRGWFVDFDSVMRPDIEMRVGAIHETFESALQEFESEKKKHSQDMVIVQVGITAIYDGSHITYEDAYGDEPDENGWSRSRSWDDADREGRASIPDGILHSKGNENDTP